MPNVSSTVGWMFFHCAHRHIISYYMPMTVPNQMHKKTSNKHLDQGNANTIFRGKFCC